MTMKLIDLFLLLMHYQCLKTTNLELQREREINYVAILLLLIDQVRKGIYIQFLSFFTNISRLDLPVSGPGKGGRVNMNQQQAVIKTFAKDTTRGN